MSREPETFLASTECRKCGQPMSGLEVIASGLVGPLCTRHLRLTLQTIRQTTEAF
jgi:hypothetical protein